MVCHTFSTVESQFEQQRPRTVLTVKAPLLRYTHYDDSDYTYTVTSTMYTVLYTRLYTYTHMSSSTYTLSYMLNKLYTYTLYML